MSFPRVDVYNVHNIGQSKLPWDTTYFTCSGTDDIMLLAMLCLLSARYCLIHIRVASILPKSSSRLLNSYAIFLIYPFFAGLENNHTDLIDNYVSKIRPHCCFHFAVVVCSCCLFYFCCGCFVYCSFCFVFAVCYFHCWLERVCD